MSFENALQFWTAYNRQIIEFVFVSTFVLILFIVYRQFFSKTDSALQMGAQGSPVSIDTSEIEEKLRKILEGQNSFKSNHTESAGSAHSGDGPKSMGGSEISNFTPEKISQEVEKLKTELKEKEKAIEDLKKIAPVNAASGPSDESKKLEEKIKELEGRLQEYEIISEDIADLSFYKEENNRLQKELGEAKGGSSAAIPKASESSSPKIEATAIPAVNETATVSAPVIEAPAPIPASTTAPAPTTEPSIPAVSASEKVIDDDILKEFAAAVEGQKNTEQQQQPVKELDPQKITESKELMGEFENFIKKG